MDSIIQFLGSTEFTNTIALLFGGGSIYGIIRTYILSRKLDAELKNKQVQHDTLVKEDANGALLIAIANALVEANMPPQAKLELKNQMNKYIDIANGSADKALETVAVQKEIVVDNAKRVIDKYLGE